MDALNFPLILFLLTLITGLIWALEFFHLRKKREREYATACRSSDDPKPPVPAWIDYSASFFPILLIVFVLRSFVVEPFQIPSSSMRPTLVVGDFILVNKYSYGIRLPIIEKKIISTGKPQRGDVVVFRNPPNPSEDYIKRIIGVPGDVVEYHDRKLFVNGQPLPQQETGNYSYLEGHVFTSLSQSTETTQSDEGVREYTIAKNSRYKQSDLPGFSSPGFLGACVETDDSGENGFRCTVPEGYYWVMGDNRDNSLDSRWWGFLPDENLRGKAFFIWFNWEDISSFAFDRVGNKIK